MPDAAGPAEGQPGDDSQGVAERSTAQMMDGDRASAALGIEVLNVSPGAATVAMTVRDDMVNGWGICHGGLLATLADTAFAVACNSHGRVTVAAGFDVSFLEAGRAGDRLVAQAREVVLRGRSGIYDVTVRREADGATLAEFRGRSRATGEANPGATPR